MHVYIIDDLSLLHHYDIRYRTVPSRTATDHLSFKKIAHNQRKTPFFIKTFGVFNANFSDSAKHTIT
jgi:hypothetical protein